MKLDFDIDDYLNRYIPRPWLHRLPRWLSWELGFREHRVRKVPTVIVWLWTFIGSFCGVSVVQAIFQKSQYFVDRHVVTSMGASAVLLYGEIEVPFAQPRAVVIGHTISAVIGVGITKLFLHLSPASFEDNVWLAGALVCATASTIMAITKTIHPPAVGTAIIAATQADIRAMGWYYVPVILLSAVLMIAVGLITNNIQRRYPMYWWTSLPLDPARQEEQEDFQNCAGPQHLSLDFTGSGTSRSLGDVEKGADAVVLSLEQVIDRVFKIELRSTGVS